MPPPAAVEVSGLRWLSLSVLAPVLWAGRVWALPVLTVLCPKARFYDRLGRALVKLTERARQAVLQLARWLPERRVVVVADSGFSIAALLATVSERVTVVTRLRLDAALYSPVLPRRASRGRPRRRGARQPTLTAQRVTATWPPVVLSRWYGKRGYTVEAATGTGLRYRAGVPGVWLRWIVMRDPSGPSNRGAFCAPTIQSLRPWRSNGTCGDGAGWYLRRWGVEVTFAEVRRHLGVETQRQGSDLAITRTTPCTAAAGGSWGCSQSWRWWRTVPMPRANSGIGRARGIEDRPRRSATRWRRCSWRRGRRRVSLRPVLDRGGSTFRRPCSGSSRAR